ncbi:MAG TPA: hypothetical protein PK230_10965, partial [Chitinophagales bacterium]|nr:hypothetical protein [Chitinophagales bacterium]
IGCDGKYIFECLPDTIRIADLLANDRGVDTATATITCFRSIRGNIDYTVNNGLLIINNASTGLNVLTYLPTNPNTGEHTNATNIYFYVQPCMDNCTLTEDCNVVCNPSLYLPQCDGNIPIQGDGTLECATANYSWGDLAGTVDYTTNYAPLDDGVIAIRVSPIYSPTSQDDYIGEAFFGGVGVEANQKYIVAVRKKKAQLNESNNRAIERMNIVLTNDPLASIPANMLPPDAQTILQEHDIDNTEWNLSLACIAPLDTNYSKVIVCAVAEAYLDGTPPGIVGADAMLFFDRIDIIPDNFPSDTTLINHADCNISLGLGDSTLCMPIEQISYQWQQQTNNSWNTIAGATTPYWEVTTNSTASCVWYRLIRYVDTANNYAAPVAPTANGACIADTAYYQICVGDTLHIVGNTVICQGGVTNLSADVIGTYTWNTGATTQSINVSTADTYSVTVTNAQGCSATASATVAVNPLPNITTTATQPTCGLSNGSISVTPTGGAYNWTGGLSDSNPTDVAAGTYTVTVTSGGCSSTASVTLNTSQAATANITGTTT